MRVRGRIRRPEPSRSPRLRQGDPGRSNKDCLRGLSFGAGEFWVVSATVEDKAKRKRRSRIPAGPAGARRVRDELLRRGFDARLPDRYTKKYDVLVGQHGSPPKPFHVRTVHVGPWYVRSSHFAGAAASEVTVYVLFGIEKNRMPLVSLSPGTAIWRLNSVSRRIGANLD